MKTNKPNRHLVSYLILFAVIFCVFMFFRAYNLDQRIIFDWDQENYATQIRDLVQKGDITLLGPRTTHDRGFFLAPYFTYLMVPFYIVTNLHPSGSIGFVLTYNVLFFISAAIILSRLFNARLAALFLTVWALHFWMIEYDTIPWWPIVVPLGILTTWYLLKRCVEGGGLGWWVTLGITMGLFINMHFQYIFILLFSGLVISLHYLLNNKYSWKGIGAMASAFAAMFTPLILFDIRHNFMNASLFFNFFFGSGNDLGAKTRFEWIPVMTNAFQPFLYVKNDLLTIFFLITVLALLVYLARVKEGFKKTFYIASSMTWVLTVVFFIAYGQRPSEYYFIYLIPIILVAIIDFFQSIGRFNYTLIFLGLFVLMNLYMAFYQTRTRVFGMHTKEKTVRYLEKLHRNNRFNVSFDVSPGREPGYGYLLKYYGIPKHTEGNPNDPLIEVRIPPKEPSDVKITDDIGLKIPPTIRK